MSALASAAETDVHLRAAADHGRRALARDLVEHLEGVLHVLLQVAAERAAEGVEQVALGLVDGLVADVLDTPGRRPTGPWWR